jgi:radial spoke head protein 9
MDVSDSSYLSGSGQTLNIAERAALDAALQQQTANKVKGAQFWGKITTTGAEDYIITQSLEEGFASVPTKKFYYCTSGSNYTLKELPAVGNTKADKAKNINSKFTGDAAAVLAEYESKTEEGSTESLTEEDRLSYVVRSIDSSVSIVPKGAYIVEATHDVVKNRYFEGLNASSAASLSSYFHFRPATGAAKHVLKQGGLIATTDFLDTITSDMPINGSWSISFNETRSAVSVRSLVYPGYYFWHVLNTGKFGAAYFGNGLPERDIVFMI